MCEESSWCGFVDWRKATRKIVRSWHGAYTVHVHFWHHFFIISKRVIQNSFVFWNVRWTSCIIMSTISRSVPCVYAPTTSLGYLLSLQWFFRRWLQSVILCLSKVIRIFRFQLLRMQIESRSLMRRIYYRLRNLPYYCDKQCRTDRTGISPKCPFARPVLVIRINKFVDWHTFILFEWPNTPKSEVTFYNWSSVTSLAL